MPDSPDLSISWPEYYEKIEYLAAKIYQSQWEFNQIVCLARGGLRIGDTLSRLYNLPLAILAASSYGGPGGQVRGTLTFARDLAMTTANLGNRVLVVDDLLDSGITLQKALLWLDRSYGFYIDEMRTAVIWWKATSAIAPDYYADYLPHSPWIHQPFETYEQMTPAQLAQTYFPDPVQVD